MKTQNLRARAVMLEEELYETAWEIGRGSASAGIRRALEAYRKPVKKHTGKRYVETKGRLSTSWIRQVLLTDSHVEVARNIGEGNASEGVRRAIREYR